MKLKRLWHKPYGLWARLILTLIPSAVLGVIVFCIMNFASEAVLTDYFAQTGFEENHIERQRESLQEYIDENRISSDDLSLLKKWEKRQPVILLELFNDEECIYSSLYRSHSSEVLSGQEDPSLYAGDNAVEIKLADCPVTALIYSDFTYQYYIVGKAISYVMGMSMLILVFLVSNSSMVQYIIRLNDEVKILEGGDLDYTLSIQGNDEITDLAGSINRMSSSLREQVENEQKLHRASQQLVTEMSHDLRTPLTSIMLYLEILRTNRYEGSDQLNDYLEKIDSKAHHLKRLTDHLFEYALEGTPARLADPQTMEQAFSGAVRAFIDDLTAREYNVVSELEWETSFVQVKSDYISRIFENILSNITKYAERSAEIRVDTVSSDRYCGFTVMNSCSPDLTGAESNGIGIESIRTMMKQMGGVCTVEQTETVFEISLLFPRI